MHLSEIGLSDYEAKVFKAMLKLGKTSAGRICQESGVSYGRIYEVLASLERKGLVKVVPEETKKFVISDINHVYEMIGEKQEELKKLKAEIKSVKEKYTEVPEAVTIVHGKRNFFKVFRELQRAKTKFVYTIKYLLDTHPEIIKQEKENIRKWRIDVKTLLPINEETEKNLEVWKRVHKNFRIIDNGGVAMSILEGEVMITLIKANTILLVKNKEFSNVMKQLFIKAYDNSKPAVA